MSTIATDAGPLLAMRRAQVARATALSLRTLDRLIASGQFPPPDRVAGRCQLWRVETVRAWLREGDKSC